MGVGLHRFKSQLYHLHAVLLQASYFISLCLMFLTIKLRYLPYRVAITI